MRRFIAAILLMLPTGLFAQYGFVDHWETAVFASDNWRYFEGTTAPDSGWNATNYNDAAWKTGQGGIGYDDGDDSTIIQPVISLYMRKEFHVFDTSKIHAIILSADFDDAFVAYLNGFEITRENIGTPWVEPAYNDVADAPREAQMYQGGKPSNYTIRRNQLNYAMRPGKNVLAIQVHNNYAGSSDMSSIFFLHAGIRDQSNFYADPPEWFEIPPVFTAESHLPVIHLHTGTLNDSVKVPGTMDVFYDKNGAPNRYNGTGNHYSGNITIKYRGNSTLAFPKKSFRFETNDTNGANLDVPLLGFPQENDWVLYAPYIDKSLVRNVLTYRMGEELSEWSPRTKYVEVMHNGYYIGVYVLTEKIKQDDNRVNINNMRSWDTTGTDLTGGYIFRMDWGSNIGQNAFELDHNLSYPGHNESVFQFDYPDEGELHPKQADYLKQFLTNFEVALLSDGFESKYHTYIDKLSFADYFLISELSKDIDAFRFSVFMHKNHVDDDGKIHMGPVWDYNLGYGNVDYGTEGAMYTYSWLYNGGFNRMFWYLRLFEDPAFTNFTNCRWFELRQTVFHTDTVMGMIDQAIEEMGPAVGKNHYLWKTLGRYISPNYFVGDTYGEEIDYLKSWIDRRLEWIDINIPGDCAEIVSTEGDHNENDIGGLVVKAYPNPVADHLFIDLDKSETVQSIEVYNAIGKMVHRKDVESSGPANLELPFSGYPQGVYLVKVAGKGGHSHQFKIVK